MVICLPIRAGRAQWMEVKVQLNCSSRLSLLDNGHNYNGPIMAMDGVAFTLELSHGRRFQTKFYPPPRSLLVR